MNARRWILGITGASGSIYAARFLEVMTQRGELVDVVVSPSGEQVLDYEGGREALQLASRIFADQDFFAPPASGSASYAGMAIVPCSMGTLGRIAGGVSDSLLTRAADVCLKECRTLVLVPREMPLSRIHLENMLRVQQAGARIVPASPSFYRNPQSIADLVDSVIAKILEQLGIRHQLVKEWGAQEP